MVALDVLYQRTVPVAKVLPPLVIVRLAPESKINAELGLVIAHACRIFCIQLGKQGVGLMQRHGLTLFQMGAFTPKHRNNRLRCRVKGRSLGLVWRLLFLRLFGFLFCLALLLKLGQMAVNIGYQLIGCFSDGFKGGFQLGQLPPGTPTGHIAKGIVRCVQPVVLADGIRHAFGLHLTGAAVWPVSLFGGWGVLVDGVELGMGDLMDSRFQGLQLTHALVNGNPLFFQMVVAVCAALDVLKGNRHRRRLFQRGEKILILFHAAGQLGHGNVRDFLALGLAHVKDRDDAKGRDFNFPFLGYGLAVCADHRLLGSRVDFLHLLFHLVGGRGQYLDAFFAFLHMALKVVPPLTKTGNQRGVRLLHGDQQRIVEAVIMELGHRREIGFVLFTFKKGLYSGFQTVSDLFHALGIVLSV